MALSLCHRERAKNRAVASATASHVGTVLPRPRSAQADGARWAARLAAPIGNPDEACADSVELTAIWENGAHPGNSYAGHDVT